MRYLAHGVLWLLLFSAFAFGCCGSPMPIYVYDFYPYYSCTLNEEFQSSELENFTRFQLFIEILNATGFEEGVDYRLVCFSDYSIGSPGFTHSDEFIVLDEWITTIMADGLVPSSQIGKDPFIVMTYRENNPWIMLLAVDWKIYITIFVFPFISGLIAAYFSNDMHAKSFH